jgi:hypothetical protein
MAGFQYKDLMITVGCGIPSYPVPCLCSGWSYVVTYKHRPQVLEAMDYVAGPELPCVLVHTGGLRPCGVFHTYGVPVGCPGLISCRTTPYVRGGGGLGDPDPETLAFLKRQLQEALADVERQEHAFAESMQPQTEAEVEELETKLHGAISELEKRKLELKRKDK